MGRRFFCGSSAVRCRVIGLIAEPIRTKSPDISQDAAELRKKLHAYGRRRRLVRLVPALRARSALLRQNLLPRRLRAARLISECPNLEGWLLRGPFTRFWRERDWNPIQHSATRVRRRRKHWR